MLVTLAFGIGHTEIIVILAVIVIIFGAAKLPQLGSAIGQTVKNFRRGMREAKAEEEECKKAEEQKKLEDKDGKDDHSENKSA